MVTVTLHEKSLVWMLSVNRKNEVPKKIQKVVDVGLAMSKSKCGSTSGSCNDNGGCVTIDEAIAQVVTNGKQPQKAIELMVPPSNPADLEAGANSNRRSPRSPQRPTRPQKRKPRKLPLARALLAEALGTACIVLVGCGSVCSSLSGAYQGIWQVAAVWGIGVTLDALHVRQYSNYANSSYNYSVESAMDNTATNVFIFCTAVTELESSQKGRQIIAVN